MLEIKIGDRVRITEIDEVCGFWIPEMDETVGKEGTVIDVNGVMDVFVRIENGLLFYYPPSVVELVKETEDE